MNGPSKAMNLVKFVTIFHRFHGLNFLAVTCNVRLAVLIFYKAHWKHFEDSVLQYKK